MSKDNTAKRSPYEDILYHSHHVSQHHPPMPMTDRAAQFSPFAALTGYDKVIKEAARLTNQRPELSEAEKAVLDDRLRRICACPGEKPELIFTYFMPDQQKKGGSYRTASGRIKQLDFYKRQIVLEDKTRIDMDGILDIEEASSAGAEE